MISGLDDLEVTEAELALEGVRRNTQRAPTLTATLDLEVLQLELHRDTTRVTDHDAVPLHGLGDDEGTTGQATSHQVHRWLDPQDESFARQHAALAGLVSGTGVDVARGRSA